MGRSSGMLKLRSLLLSYHHLHSQVSMLSHPSFTLLQKLPELLIEACEATYRLAAFQAVGLWRLII